MPIGFLRSSPLALISVLSISPWSAAATIEWPSKSGIIWTVDAGDGAGPMGTNLSASNVWKDSKGYLHLRITKKRDPSTGSYKWYCAQLQTNLCYHYGTYQWLVASDVSKLDKNVVLGMFNYPTSPCAVGPDQTNEIDIEMARWGKAKGPRGNFTVWPEIPPYSGANWTCRFRMPFCKTSMHQFIWNPESVQLASYKGYVLNTKRLIKLVPFEPVDSSSIPQSPIPILINLWLYKGLPPAKTSAKYEVLLKSFTYQQCTVTLNPTDANFSASGGLGTFDVMASGSNCAWTASNDSPAWITGVTASGTGTGTVSYTVLANNGAARTGHITVQGQTHTITQDNGCAYSLSSDSQNFSGTGGSGSFTVNTQAGCDWTTSNDSTAWITGVTAGGTGSGPVSYTVAENTTGTGRTGHITVQGQTHTVTQDNLHGVVLIADTIPFYTDLLFGQIPTSTATMTFCWHNLTSPVPVTFYPQVRDGTTLRAYAVTISSSSGCVTVTQYAEVPTSDNSLYLYSFSPGSLQFSTGGGISIDFP